MGVGNRANSHLSTRKNTGAPLSSLKPFPQATDKPDWRWSLKNRRRTRRIPYLGPLCIFWDNEHGQTKYLHAKFLDISERGLRIEVREPLPVGAFVSIRADRIILSGSATVRYVERCGSKYFLGLELSAVLRGQAQTLFQHPSADAPALVSH